MLTNYGDGSLAYLVATIPTTRLGTVVPAVRRHHHVGGVGGQLVQYGLVS
jgi:hypothetical protein